MRPNSATPADTFTLLQNEGYLMQGCLKASPSGILAGTNAQPGPLYAAFFNYAIGMERLLKNLLLLDNWHRECQFLTNEPVLGALAFLIYRFIFLPAPPDPPDPADSPFQHTTVFHLNTSEAQDSAPSPFLIPIPERQRTWPTSTALKSLMLFA